MLPYPPAASGPTIPINTLSSKVELRISCLGLLDRDALSKSDPLVAVYFQDAKKAWYEVGRTERIINTLNPEFTKSIELEYRFEEVQHMKFSVFDLDNDTKTLDDDDELGELICTLGQIVSNKVYTKRLKCKGGENGGTITIAAEELKGANEEVFMKFRANNLDNKDFLGKSDPFLEICRDRGDGVFSAVCRSEVIDNNLNPSWKSISVESQKLCSGNYDLQLLVKCFDHDSDGGHDLIGEFRTTLGEMLQGQQNQLSWECINPKKKSKKKGYKNSGIVHLEHIKVHPIFTFLDFIMAGCQINFTVGVDFTGSNGSPSHPDSLHYYGSQQPSEYLQALMSVAEVCQDYDTDKLFPAFGFGALTPTSREVSFEFPLNGDPANPYCAGIGGLVASYQACVRQVSFSGPTYVAPIIRHVARFAEQASRDGTASNYFILLLLTDGVLSDMDQAKRAIIEASYLPMSIIIVGIGGANFDDMDALDCDTGLLNIHGHCAFRDIVQFVPFRKFKGATAAVLAQAVLSEVPKQVTDYFRLKNIYPRGVSVDK